MADYLSNWKKNAFILLCGTSFILVNFKIIKKHSVFINLHTMNLFNSFSGTKYSVAYHFNLLLQGLTKKITYTFTNGTYSNTLRMTNIG